jgi:hypothetical protein
VVHVARASLSALSLLLLLAGPAAAQGKELAWKLGGDKVRYDLTAQAPAPPLPAGVPWAPAPFQLLGTGDLEENRRPRLPVKGATDLVWYYAFHLPGGPLPGKKRPRTVEVDARFPIKSGAKKGHLTVRGNHSVRAKSKRATIRSSLLVSSSLEGDWLKKGNLTITRQFSLKRGQLERAEFSYELTVTHEGEQSAHVIKGSIQPQREVVPVDAPEFHVQVSEAIDRGAAWLADALASRMGNYKKSDRPRHALGRVALPCFALLRSGIPPKRLAAYFDWMASLPLEDTYSVSLWIMALEARSVERKVLPPQPRTRSVARFRRGQVPKNDQDRIRKATEWLVQTRKAGEGWWSYFGKPGKPPLGHDMATEATRGDRSNSQFAVLALHSALASGVDVPGEVWEEILEEGAAAQAPDGPPANLEGSHFNRRSPMAHDPRDEPVSPETTTTERGPGTRAGLKTGERLRAKARGWAYPMKGKATQDNAYGSMSAAGLSSLAVAREGLRVSRRLTAKRAAAADEAIRDGLGWLLANFDAARNPNRGTQHYFYWAYSLEKAMDTSGVERLGSREWWRDLSAELLARQEDDGSWSRGNLEHTAFALLVLNRATLPVELNIGEAKRVATGERDGSTWDLAAVEGVGQLSVRELLEAMVSSPDDAKARLSLAKKALAALREDQRPRLIPELSTLASHPDRGVRRWAAETCRNLAGSAKPADLERFSARWEVLRRAGDGEDHGQIEDVRSILRDPKSPVPLKQQAIRVLGRLRAVEAVEDLIGELGAKSVAYREFVWLHLTGMAGGEHRPYDPAAGERARKAAAADWRAYWKAEGPERVTAERVRRDVLNLALDARAEAAGKRLKAIGKPALPGLVDGLRSESTRSRAHALLKAISGKDLPAQPDPWLEWLEQG